MQSSQLAHVLDDGYLSSQKTYTFDQTLKAAAVGLSTALIIWAIAAGGIIWLYKEAHDAQFLLVKENMKQLSELAASQLDGDQHAKLTKGDQGSLNYKEVIAPLLRFHEASPSIYYLYTLRPKNDSYEFVLDTAYYRKALEGHETLSPSLIGDPYTYKQPNEQTVLKNALQNHHSWAFDAPVTDEFGQFIMAGAPFYTSNGELSGIVGVDHHMAIFEQAMDGIQKGTTRAITLVGVIALILGLIVTRVRLTALQLKSLREQSERNLKNAEYTLRDMAENVPGVIFRCYCDSPEKYGFLYISPRSNELFGFEASEALEAGSIANLPTDEQQNFWPSLVEAALKNQEWSLEGRIELPSGITRWWKGLAKPQKESNGRVIFNGVLIDISERKAFEAELRDSKIAAEEANRAKSDFLANMSHEIRTPLNGVLGMAAILGSTPLTAEQTDCVLTIQSSSELLLSVINDVLDLSKIEAGRLELESHPFHFFEAIKSLVELLRPKALEKNLTFIFEYASDLPHAFLGDEGRIKQILLNLLSNAIKFTHQGSITLRITGALKEGQIWNIQMQVKDTGIGIPSNKQTLMFQPFRQAHSYTTRKYGGTGLGLSICHKLAELMHGTIYFTSEESKGSTFSVQLQMAAVYIPEKRRTTDSLSPLPVTTPLRILLAEDNPVNQKVAGKILEKLGYHVDIVNNGQEALSAALESSYDLILMDIQMPVMDGLEATRQIKTQKTAPHPRIIALTAHALNEQVAECRAAGMDGHLAKPIHIAALKEVLASTQKLPGLN